MFRWFVLGLILLDIADFNRGGANRLMNSNTLKAAENHSAIESTINRWTGQSSLIFLSHLAQLNCRNLGNDEINALQDKVIAAIVSKLKVEIR